MPVVRDGPVVDEHELHLFTALDGDVLRLEGEVVQSDLNLPWTGRTARRWLAARCRLILRATAARRQQNCQSDDHDQRRDEALPTKQSKNPFRQINVESDATRFPLRDPTLILLWDIELVKLKKCHILYIKRGRV